LRSAGAGRHAGAALPAVSGPAMNRYPLWKYLLITAAVVIGFLYTLPNFFG